MSKLDKLNSQIAESLGTGQQPTVKFVKKVNGTIINIGAPVTYHIDGTEQTGSGTVKSITGNNITITTGPGIEDQITALLNDVNLIDNG